MPVGPPDYLQNGYPTLSFCYALFGDKAWSSGEFAKWKADNTYKGFLDNYNKVGDPDANKLPKDVQDVSTVKGHLPPPDPDAPAPVPPAPAVPPAYIGIPANGPTSGEFYVPTPNQARVGIRKIFTEIKNQNPPAARAAGRKDAELGPERPVLRILAVLYLNQLPDPNGLIPASINALNVSAQVKQTLTRFIPPPPPAPQVLPAVMDDAEGKALEGVLVDEFIGFPWIW
jgi:hypothetical protein